MKIVTIIYLLISYPIFSLGQTKQFADKSLKSEDYLKLGFPSVEKIWSADDYEKATQILVSIYSKNKFQLPRKYSANSSAIFNKISNLNNLKSIKKREFQLRTSEYNRIYKCVIKLNNIYGEAGSGEISGMGFSSEIIDIMIMVGFISIESSQGVNEYIDSKSKTITNSQKQQLEKTFKKHEGGLNKVISGFFDLIQLEYLFFLKKDILTLSHFYIKVIPQSVNLLSTKDFIEIKKRIDEIIKNHEYTEIKADMRILKKKI